MVDICSFWGKAQPVDPGQGPDWHPLAFHSLDVAAVGHAILTSDRSLRDRFCALLGMKTDVAVPIICYLLAIHDIGKFAKKFQAKAPRHFPKCFDTDPEDVATSYDHGNGGLRLFDVCEAAFQLPRDTGWRAWRPLIAAVAGHHGSPPPGDRSAGIVSLYPDFGKAGIDAARDFLGLAHELFDVPARMPTINANSARRTSFALAGFAVLADWLGSNQEWFGYRAPNSDLEEYWRSARQRARKAIDKAGVIPADKAARVDFDDLIGVAGAKPTPMQRWVQELDLPECPAMFLIEDETGSGKTEAAVMLAHRLMSAGAADGIYVALPTMATANAMFDRLARTYRLLFGDHAEPSIALAHGARGMHEGFRGAVLPGGRVESGHSGESGSTDESEITASAACSAWIADDRRRTFLADVGVGTIDQALLSILPTRHQSLRLLGLMRRVLVLDEVHAYDAFMQSEIERLIEFQAGLGGSVVLLSATLPESIRSRLSAAFMKGVGMDTPDGDTSFSYPLATVCTNEGVACMSIDGSTDRARRLPVRFLRSVDAAYVEVVAAAQAGQAVLYLRNSVDDALDAYRELTDRGLATQLFHARFALADRLAIERRVLETFGKRSSPERRLHDDGRGQVLVATQVVEQSLDLDFDAMVTDLAPIDLLVQRAGRLWRHNRPGRPSGDPELLVVGPEPLAQAVDTWFSELFPRAAFVYQNHALLWLTARVLQDSGAIESPAGLRTLVEAVYGPDAPDNIPAGLDSSYWDEYARSNAERSIGAHNALEFDAGYIRDGGVWDLDHKTPTRINDDEQVILRLARVIDGRIEPWAQESPSGESWRAWRLSEVTVSARRIGSEAVAPEHARAAKDAKADWTRYEDDRILVVLEQNPSGNAEHWVGRAAAPGSGSDIVEVRYDRCCGLAVIADRPVKNDVPANLAG